MEAGNLRKRRPKADTDAARDLPGVKPAVSITPNSTFFEEEYTGIGSAPLQKTKSGRIIVPRIDNPFADRVLFMIAPAKFNGEMHAIARGVGTAERGEYKSHLLHGRMRSNGDFEFDKFPIELGDNYDVMGHGQEDPRVVKMGDTYYITFTDVPPDGKTRVGLASTADFQNYEYHGTLVPHYKGRDAKDAIFFPGEGGKTNMLVRFKSVGTDRRSGIQLVEFDRFQQVLTLAENPNECKKYWDYFLARNGSHLGEYDPERDHLHPDMPEMRAREAQWKPGLDGLIDEVLRLHPYRELLKEPNPARKDRFWYGPGPALIMTEGGLLGFPHRGQVIAEYTRNAKRELKAMGKRADLVRFYCVMATLHDPQDPRKLIAASPTPVSMPNPQSEWEMRIQDDSTTPFVKIAVGAARVMLNGVSHLLVPMGVNDKYTRPELFNEREFLSWMLTHGRV